MKINAIIIEDEEPARKLLKTYLKEHEEINLLGEFSDGLSGVKAIQEFRPDLVFLDIQMPKLNGFEVLELSEFKPMIIFTTAYDQYAIKAFEANAVDYLLKPFSRERFADALKKAKVDLAKQITDSGNLKSAIAVIDEKPEILERIAVRSGSKIHLIPAGDILYIEADGDYVKFHTKEGSHLKEKPMKYFETHLDPKQFARIHRSYIANVNFIQRLDYYDKESYSAVLKDGTQLKVSSNGYKLLRELLKM
jgi:two-component system, LytTR family, response regulator